MNRGAEGPGGVTSLGSSTASGLGASATLDMLECCFQVWECMGNGYQRCVLPMARVVWETVCVVNVLWCCGVPRGLQLLLPLLPFVLKACKQALLQSYDRPLCYA